jgi:integration host factor subunit alpha
VDQKFSRRIVIRVPPADDAVCFRGNVEKPDGILDAAVSRSTVTRDDLAHAIYARIPSLSRADAKALLDCARSRKCCPPLTSGEDVSLRGFGTFRIRSKNARPGHNPKTGAAALISSRRRVQSGATSQIGHGGVGSIPDRRRLSVERSPARRGVSAMTADVANRAPPAQDASPNLSAAIVFIRAHSGDASLS